MNKTDKPQQNDKDHSRDNAEEKLGFLQVLGSVLAAFFGVQSHKNKVRDFTRGDHRVFIAAGIILTIAFLATVITAVQIVLH